MNQYKQTDADLNSHCYEQPEPEAIGEQIASVALAIVIGIGIACALVAWWSN